MSSAEQGDLGTSKIIADGDVFPDGHIPDDVGEAFLGNGEPSEWYVNDEDAMSEFFD